MSSRISSYDGEGAGALRRLKPVCLAIIILTIAFFLVDSVVTGLVNQNFHSFLINFFGLSVGGLLSGSLWQPLSFAFVPLADLSHAFIPTLFSVYFFYAFGNSLEARLGSRAFLSLFLCGSTLAGLLAVPIAFLFAGSGGFSLPVTFNFAPALAILVVSALFYPSQSVRIFFVLPIRMSTIAWIFTGAAFFATLVTLRWGGGFPHLVELCGALMGYLWFKYLYRLRFHFLQKYLGYLRFKRNKLKIIDGNRDDYAKNSDKYIN